MDTEEEDVIDYAPDWVDVYTGSTWPATAEEKDFAERFRKRMEQLRQRRRNVTDD